VSADPLADVLGMVRLAGGVFLSGEFSAPFSILAALTPQESLPFDLEPRQIIAYHYVVEGKCSITVEQHLSIDAAAGEIVLLPQNDMHIVSSAPGLAPLLRSKLELPPPVNGVSHIAFGGGGEKCRILCGFLGSEDDFNPLIATLPKILKLDVMRLGTSSWIESSMKFAVNELAQGRLATSTVMSRLSELLFVEAVRSFAAQTENLDDGWLRGLSDRQIGRALALVHRDLQRAWAIEDLAREAGLSRTAFINRFIAATGVPPMTYRKSWRLRTAKILLMEQPGTVAQVGYSVGYGSEEAFSRAFKKEFGVSPASFAKAGAG
jgi:AraC-like DNA-binding protein